MRIQCLENLRVPPQGSSTEGESGPKITLNAVLPLVGPEGRRRLGAAERWLSVQGRKVPLFFQGKKG